MNRTTAVALVTTAVIGLGGGTATALFRGHERATTSPSAGHSHSPSTAPASRTASPTKQATGAAHVPATLLYANPGVIHDGSRRIAFDDDVPKVPEAVVPSRLVRVHSGYLVAYDTSEQAPEQGLYFIARDGTRTHVGDVSVNWSVSPLGDRVAAMGLDGRLEVLDLNGKVVARWAFRTDTPGLVSLSWQRASVLVSAAGPSGRWEVYQWLPDTGVHDRVSSDGLADLQVSPDGGTVIGQVQSGTAVANGDSNTCMAGGPFPGAAEKRWTTCDWRIYDVPHAFSPQGDLVLARLRASDDAGPWRVAVMGRNAGTSDSMRVVDLPDRATEVQWLDEQHLVTVGPVGGGPADLRVWLKSCDLEGHCSALLQSREGRFVLGEQS